MAVYILVFISHIIEKGSNDFSSALITKGYKFRALYTRAAHYFTALSKACIMYKAAE